MHFDAFSQLAGILGFRALDRRGHPLLDVGQVDVGEGRGLGASGPDWCRARVEGRAEAGTGSAPSSRGTPATRPTPRRPAGCARLARISSPWAWYLSQAATAATSCGPVVRMAMSVWTWVEHLLGDRRRPLGDEGAAQAARAAAADDVLPGPEELRLVAHRPLRDVVVGLLQEQVERLLVPEVEPAREVQEERLLRRLALEAWRCRGRTRGAGPPPGRRGGCPPPRSSGTSPHSPPKIGTGMPAPFPSREARSPRQEPTGSTATNGSPASNISSAMTRAALLLPAPLTARSPKVSVTASAGRARPSPRWSFTRDPRPSRWGSWRRWRGCCPSTRAR